MHSALADYDLGALEQRFADWGHSPGHAASVLRAFLTTGDPTPPADRRLPRVLSERLREQLGGRAASVAARQVSVDGTTKLLLRLVDGRTVESVLMPDFRGDRAAGCLSSQVGCAMGCDFCATTRTGFERNLSPGEIVEQYLALRAEAQAVGRRLGTVVFMGMGEPMLNLDNVLTAIRRLGDNRLGGLGWRQITVSTVGIVPGIDALSATNLNVSLAVSLHAPDDATRERLLPVGRRFPVADILAAVDRFQARQGRPVTLQYCLLRGVNDTRAHAELLAVAVGARRVHVNLLHYNPTGTSLRGVDFMPSTDSDGEAFARVLHGHGIVAHFRRSRGPEIDAACGQLRRREGESGGAAASLRDT